MSRGKIKTLLVMCLVVSTILYAFASDKLKNLKQQVSNFPFITSIFISQNPVTLNTTFTTETTLNVPGASGLCELRINNVLFGQGFYSGDFTQGCFPATIDPLGLQGGFITKVGNYPISWTFTPQGCNDTSCVSIIEETLQVVTNIQTPTPTPTPTSSSGGTNLAECPLDTLHARAIDKGVYSKHQEIEDEIITPALEEVDEELLQFQDKYDLDSFQALDKTIEALESLNLIQREIRRSSRNISNEIVTLIISIIDALGEEDGCREKIEFALDLLDESLSTLEGSSVDLFENDDLLLRFEELLDQIDSSLEADNNSDEIPDICTAFGKINTPEEDDFIGNITELPEDVLSQPIPGQFIVEFVSSEEGAPLIAEQLANEYGLEILTIYDKVFQGALFFVPNGNENELAIDPRVKQLAQDYTASVFENGNSMSDGSLAKKVIYQTPVSSQQVPNGINWIDAEQNPNEGGGCRVTVAVLDTGIRLNHPDLASNINTQLGVDFTLLPRLPFLLPVFFGGDDDEGHGTQVAGVIAAVDNNEGVIGVGSQIELVPVKVCTGNCSIGRITAGLNYLTALADRIEIGNLSLGGECGVKPTKPRRPKKLRLRQLKRYLRELRRYIRNYIKWKACIYSHGFERRAVARTTSAGVVLVVAAGNESVDVNEHHVFPAKLSKVITVSALNDGDGAQGNDEWAGFSNFGREVDIIAPGEGILTTALDGTTKTVSGTSFSAPHVAGTVALYIAKNGRPRNADASQLGYLINAISLERVNDLPGEPNDGRRERACFANGVDVRP